MKAESRRHGQGQVIQITEVMLEKDRWWNSYVLPPFAMIMALVQTPYPPAQNTELRIAGDVAHHYAIGTRT